MIKAKIFQEVNVQKLEDKINKFLMKGYGTLLREHFTTIIDEDGWHNSILLIYDTDMMNENDS